jgi:cyclophilin family peptidyl-prolyl cis-trans isomerase
MLKRPGKFRRILIGMLLPTILFASGVAYTAENPKVKIHTNVGDIILELYPDKAPKSVANFLQYVEEDFYTDTVFHRVIDGFMIQGGGFSPHFERKTPRAPIINEADNGLKNTRGTVAMARTSDPHSATAQFFINVVDNPFLDHTDKTPRGWGYTVFGHVIQGIDVVDAIRTTPTGSGGPFPRDVPKSPIIILSATYINKPQPATEEKTEKPSVPAAPALK